MALNYSIQLNTSLALSFELRRGDIISLFDKITNMWLPVSEEDLKKQKNKRLEIISKYKVLYDKSKNDLLNTIGNIAKGVQEKKKFNKKWMNQWIDTNTSINERIKNSSDIEKSKLELMVSYIHMNNNRLGILGQDEAFIAFLISQGIKDLHIS